MAKTFKDNPAVMQFLSTAQNMEESSPVEEKATATDRLATPDGYKINPLYVEKKTRRVQLVLQPSVYEKTKAMAAECGLSLNEYIHSLLEREINNTEV